MKAAFNGALNLSILDGWWDEAYTPDTGWAIGRGEPAANHDDLDRIEASALYDLLEHEVVPLFYKRAADGLPKGWIALMRSAMISLCPVFNTNRMLHQYLVTGYQAAEARRALLEADGFARARALASWKARVRAAWAQVHVERVEAGLAQATRVGDEFDVRAWIRTGSLGPGDLLPQVYVGRLRDGRDIAEPVIVPMAFEAAESGGAARFLARIRCRTSGTHGLTIRVIPHHEDLGHPHETGLITWANA
jgi:starch phosphorylase